jgi:glycosyltransferase involved in cell wall biosynthesis
LLNRPGCGSNFPNDTKRQGIYCGRFFRWRRHIVEEVKELVSSYGLNDNIILTGYRKDVPAIMQLMDLVVHASTKPESFGMVLIEGMAMGKPIVTTKMGRTTRYSGRWKDGISCRAG